MQDAVEQCDVGAGQQRQVQVGQLAGVGAPRVDHDDADLRPSGLGGFQATEQDRVGEGHVAAGDQHAIGAVEVFVAARRCVGAQAALVADHRRGHAQARIAVDVVGADQSPRQLVEGVVVLGQQLAGDIEGHAVRPVFANGLGETPGGMFQGTPSRCEPAPVACPGAVGGTARGPGGRRSGAGWRLCCRVCRSWPGAADRLARRGCVRRRVRSGRHNPRRNSSRSKRWCAAGNLSTCSAPVIGERSGAQRHAVQAEQHLSVLHPHRVAMGAALVRGHGFAALQFDLPVVQRTGHSLAVDQPLG